MIKRADGCSVQPARSEYRKGHHAEPIQTWIYFFVPTRQDGSLRGYDSYIFTLLVLDLKQACVADDWLFAELHRLIGYVIHATVFKPSLYDLQPLLA